MKKHKSTSTAEFFSKTDIALTSPEDKLAQRLIDTAKKYYDENIAPRATISSSPKKSNAIRNFGIQITELAESKKGNPVERYHRLKDGLRNFESYAQALHSKRIKEGGVTGFLNSLNGMVNGNTITRSGLEKAISTLRHQLAKEDAPLREERAKTLSFDR